MHLSVFQGPVSFSASHDLAQIDLCIDQALRCIDSGFAMVTFGEQHFNNYEPYTNPFLMAARLAPHLGDTWFGTTIVPLPFHNPLRLAEDSNVIDLLTRGRFIMGLSAARGAPFPDFANFGLDPADRLDIFASKLEYLQAAAANRLGDPLLVMDSPWDKGALNGRMMPLSWRSGGAQLAVGTITDSTIDDVARRGLPLFLSPCTLPVTLQKFARHQQGMADAGFDETHRAKAAWKSMSTRFVIVAETEEEAWDAAEKSVGRNPLMDRTADTRPLRELAAVDPEVVAGGGDRNAAWVQSWLFTGTPESITRQITEYADAGIAHLNIRFTAGAATPPVVERSLSLFVQHVLPQLDSQLFPALRPDEIEPAHTTPPVPPTFTGPPAFMGPPSEQKEMVNR